MSAAPPSTQSDDRSQSHTSEVLASTRRRDGRLGGSPLAASFRIGEVEIPNRVVLAPMAGLTTGAYRRHLKTHGAGLVTTEMVSAYGLVYGNVRTTGYLDFSEDERPIAVQLFGDTPDVLARAAEIVLSRARVPDLLDINMGCPVRKVMKTGAGAALLGDPDKAVTMAATVVRVAGEAGVPITVKLRSGLQPGDGIAVGLAGRLEEVGVQALGFHPRSASEYYRGSADHAVTAAVAGAVGIPVMVSGDILEVKSALEIYARTGASAVMAARGLEGNPWLVGALLAGRSVERPPLVRVVADLRTLLAGAAEEMGSSRAARWIRKSVNWYLRPSGVSSEIVEALRAYRDAQELDAALAALVGLDPRASRSGTVGPFDR